PIILTLCPAVFDRNIPVFDVADFLQALVKACLEIRVRRTTVEKPDHWHSRLLGETARSMGMSAYPLAVGVNGAFARNFSLIHTGEPAPLRGDDQCGARNLRYVAPDIGARDGLHKSNLSRDGGAAHEFRPPLNSFRRKVAAEATGHALAGSTPRVSNAAASAGAFSAAPTRSGVGVPTTVKVRTRAGRRAITRP